jgi:integrase/recombinase XerD
MKQAAVEQYVVHKRSLGIHFKAARILYAFCKAIGNVELEEIPAERVKSFIYGSGPVTNNIPPKRAALSGFYRYLINRGYVSESRVPTEIPKRPQSFIPHIYTMDELRRILRATANQSDRCKIEAHTMWFLILLLYGAALRVSEAISLTIHDIDLNQNVLTIRDTKFFKTRWVPISPDLRKAFDAYLKIRAGRNHPTPPEAFLLLTKDSQPIKLNRASESFKRLCKDAKVCRKDKGRYGPRLHDLRHSFAVHRLVACYREGGNVGQLLVQLSTYLGHVQLASTQYYLTLTPELLRHVSIRFENYAIREVDHD